MAEDKKKAETKEVKVETRKIKFLLSPCGVFFLPYNVGQEVEMPVNQADEIVERGYAEYVK